MEKVEKGTGGVTHTTDHSSKVVSRGGDRNEAKAGIGSSPSGMETSHSRAASPGPANSNSGNGGKADGSQPSTWMDWVYYVWDVVKEFCITFYESAFVSEAVIHKENEIEKQFIHAMGKLIEDATALSECVKYEVVAGLNITPRRYTKNYVEQFQKLPQDIKDRVRDYIRTHFANDVAANVIKLQKEDAFRDKDAHLIEIMACDFYLHEKGPPQAVTQLIKAEWEIYNKVAFKAQELINGLVPPEQSNAKV